MLSVPTACSSAIASVTPTGYFPGPDLIAASARWCAGSIASRWASALPVRKNEKRSAPIAFAAAAIMPWAPCERVLGQPREHPLEQRREVRLVERRGRRRQVAEVLRGTLAVADEVIRVGRVLPAAEAREPAGRREVPEGDDRCQAALVARREHAAVVIELGPRVDAVFRLDPRPLDREPEGVQPEARRRCRCPRDSGDSCRRRRPRAR